MAINGQPVRSVDDLLTLIEQVRPGETVVVSILRDQEPLQVKVTLGVDEP